MINKIDKQNMEAHRFLCAAWLQINGLNLAFSKNELCCQPNSAKSAIVR